jgi:hypothetical protein
MLPSPAESPPALPRWSWGANLAVALLTAGVLIAMGRVLWCTQGDIRPVSFDTWSPHNSQHLLDAYSFSHFQHGLVFFGLLALAGRQRWQEARFVAATSLEAVWEVVENTPWIIDKYRENTVSLDYVGDSVANSMSDLVFCGLGYLVARRLPWWGTLALLAVIEVAMLATIRDSLLLNVLMLVYPLDAVKAWQAG